MTYIHLHAGSSYIHLDPLLTRDKESSRLDPLINRDKEDKKRTLSQPPLINRVARDFYAARPSSKTRLNQESQHARDSTNSWGWKPKQGTKRQDTGSLTLTLSQAPLINRVARDFYDASPSSNMNRASQHARGSTHSWDYTPEHGWRRQCVVPVVEFLNWLGTLLVERKQSPQLLKMPVVRPLRTA
jgi:hypothetical protein